jgi:uncharacterized delta-60 repeat protein
MKNPPHRCCSEIEFLESRTLLSLAAPDPSFSGDGTQTFPFQGSQYTYTNTFAVQNDGKFVVVGTTRGRDRFTQIILARINPNGTPDRTFGSSGRVITRFNVPAASNQVEALAADIQIQPDGKILVAGGLGGQWAVFRFNRDGSLDKSFDRDGVQNLKAMPGEVATDLELLPNGKIVAGGWAQPGPSDSTHSRDFGLVRLNANGSIDRSFGSNGFVLSDFSRNDRLQRITVDSMGNIVAAGIADLAIGGNIVLARFRANGAVDSSFGQNGRVIAALEGYDASPSSLQALANGKILLAGTDNGDAFVMRLSSQGLPDSTFAGDGLLTFDLGGEHDSARILRADSSRLSVLGTAHPESASGLPLSTKQFIRTFRSDGSLDPASPSRELSFLSDRAQQLDGSARFISRNRLVALFTSRKTWAEGEMTLARFNANGSLDKRFGNGGSVTVDDTGPMRATPLRLLPMADGKTLVLAQLDMYTQIRFVLLRLKPNGKLDASFGKAGFIDLPPVESSERYNTIALDSAGKIIVAGSDPNLALTLLRFNANGAPDRSLAGGSRVRLPDVMASADVIVALPGQKLLVAGGQYAGIGSSTFVITRLNADGSVDKTFAENGSDWQSFLSANSADQMFVAADGKITVVGTSTPYYDLGPPPGAAGPQLFIIRYNANGTLDGSFSGDGKLVIEDASLNMASRRLSDGGIEILTMGKSQRDLRILRYKADGSANGVIDRAVGADIRGAFFEADGKIIVLTPSSTLRLNSDGSAAARSSKGPAIPLDYNFDNAYTYPSIRALAPDGKLLVGSADGDGDLVVRRYLLK